MYASNDSESKKRHNRNNEGFNKRKKGEELVNLTLNSQLELITQDRSQQPPRVEELNNLIDEMDIEKTPNKRKAPTPPEETQNQKNQVATEDTASEYASNTKAGDMISIQNKTLPKGQNSYDEFVQRTYHTETKKFQQTEERVRIKKEHKTLKIN